MYMQAAFVVVDDTLWNFLIIYSVLTGIIYLVNRNNEKADYDYSFE